MTNKSKTNKKQAKARTWLIYVFAIIFIAAAGTLVYRIIDSIAKDAPSEEIVYYDDKDSSDIEGDEYYASLERKHNFLDSWSGSHNGSIAEWVMNGVITHNKKYSNEPIQVIFNNINCGANIGCISKNKSSLTDRGEYEISYEYNNEGSVYSVRIVANNDRGWVNYFMFIPLGFVIIVAIFIFFIFIKSVRTGNKIAKNVMDLTKGDEDGFEY